MRFIQTVSLLGFAVNQQVSSFSPPIFNINAVSTAQRSSSLYSTVVELETGPPAEAEETFGTIVGDTKGAALLLDDVAISRGAEPLLKNINWSVQENERWGIVGINGAGKSTLLGAITGTVRMDVGKAVSCCKVLYI